MEGGEFVAVLVEVAVSEEEFVEQLEWVQGDGVVEDFPVDRQVEAVADEGPVAAADESEAELCADVGDVVAPAEVVPVRSSFLGDNDHLELAATDEK